MYFLQSYDDLVPAARSLELSESSSDSGSSSSSDSDSDDSTTPTPPPLPTQKNVEKHSSPIFNSPNTNGTYYLVANIYLKCFDNFNYLTLGFKDRIVDPGRILDEDLQLSETDSD